MLMINYLIDSHYVCIDSKKTFNGYQERQSDGWDFYRLSAPERLIYLVYVQFD